MNDRGYIQKMNPLHGPLERFDVAGLADACTERWFNQTLCKVNDSVLRLGVLHGEYHWHKHEDDDELFLTLEGELFIDIQDRDPVALGPGQGYVVPKGVAHRTRAPERTVVLMVETATIDPIGDEVA